MRPGPCISAGARIMFARLWLIFVALVALSDTCQAHDIYSHLTDRADRSCCTNGDCRPVHYRTTTSGVDMLIGDKWIAIPRGKLQYRVLASFFTYCAILPPSTALLD